MIYAFVVSFALGILTEKIFDFSWSTVAFGALLFFIIIGFVWKENKPRARYILIVVTALFLGTLRMVIVDVSPDPYLLKNVGSQVSFEAEIVEEPDIRDESVRYTVMVSENSFSGYSQKCTDKILLNFSSCSPQSGSQGISDNTHSTSSHFSSLISLVANRFPLYQYGDQIKVTGRLDLPKNFTGDDGEEFDYVSYLSKDKIHFLMYRPEIGPTSPSVTGLRGINHPIKYLYDLKNKFIENIKEVVPEPNSSLAAGMIFGVKQSLGEDLLDKFKKVGLIHIVVLSGQNITIIAAGLFFLTSYFLNRNRGLLVSCVGMILFGLMVGLSATVLRALVMALIAVLARYLGRPQDGLRALFIAGFLMVAWNPLTLLSDPSFHLSFMATLGLILFTPFVYQRLHFITYKFGLREIIASTIAVQIFILPLLIKISGSVSLISFIVNPLVLPFTATVMVLAGLTGGFGLISHFLSWPLGALTYLVTEFILKVVEISSAIPYVNIPIGSLPTFVIIIWYAGYAVLFYRLEKVVLDNAPV